MNLCYLWIHIMWEEESTKGVSGTRTAGQAKTKKCNPGQFVWHIEWMLAVHSFYHTFGLTAHSFSFLSCPHTVAARDLWSCVWEKERKRNGESSFFSYSGPIFHLLISEDGPEKKKDKGLSVWAVKVVTRLSARREAIGTYMVTYLWCTRSETYQRFLRGPQIVSETSIMSSLSSPPQLQFHICAVVNGEDIEDVSTALWAGLMRSHKVVSVPLLRIRSHAVNKELCVSTTYWPVTSFSFLLFYDRASNVVLRTLFFVRKLDRKASASAGHKVTWSVINLPD